MVACIYKCEETSLFVGLQHVDYLVDGNVVACNEKALNIWAGACGE